MKRIAILFLLSLTTFDLRAQETNCQTFIASLRAQEQAFLNLHFELHDQQCKGKQLAADPHSNSDAHINAFEKLPSACRSNAWKEFIRFSASQTPFDLESGAAGTIASRITSDKKTEGEFLKGYNAAIRALAPGKSKDSRSKDMWCRGKSLNAIVCDILEKHGIKKGLLCDPAHTEKSYSACTGTNSVDVKCDGDHAANDGCLNRLQKNAQAVLRACETSDPKPGTTATY